MGVLKNLWIMAKTTGHRPLSRADLFSYCEPFIKNPPAPPELRQALNEGFVRSEGKVMSLTEWYRNDHLLPALEKIAKEPTWHLQRAACLRAFLDEIHWRNWVFVSRKAKTEWGRGMILQKLNQLWPKANDEELQHYLLQFYIVTLCTYSALWAVGQTFFKFDNMKEMEVDLYIQYGRDIVSIDTDFMDTIYELHSEELDAAYHWAEWQEKNLSPITQKMLNHLAATKEQIIQDTFDVTNFKRLSDKYEAEKVALGRTLQQPA